jgi:hypothetical protein
MVERPVVGGMPTSENGDGRGRAVGVGQGVRSQPLQHALRSTSGRATQPVVTRDADQ